MYLKPKKIQFINKTLQGNTNCIICHLKLCLTSSATEFCHLITVSNSTGTVSTVWN